MEVTVICKNCGKEFTYNHTCGVKRSYCSETCQRNGTTKESYRRNPEKLKKRANVTRLEGEILAAYHGKCAICGWTISDQQVIFDKKGRCLISQGNEIHHIVALEDGGSSAIENLILLCPNHHKQANAGIISADELKAKYWRGELTEGEKQTMKNNCVDRIARAILEAREELHGNEERNNPD